MTHPPNFWIEYEEKWNILHLRFYWLVAVVCNLHLRVKDMIQIVFVSLLENPLSLNSLAQEIVVGACSGINLGESNNSAFYDNRPPILIRFR